MELQNNKAVFLDRDGTINVDKHYLYRSEDFEFIPGVIDGLRELTGMGYLLLIITNQSGIARGYYSEEDLLRLNDWLINTLLSEGVKLEKIYYCPHLPDAPVEKYRKECSCRKPKTGMFMQAVKEYGIDLSKSYAIGDRVRDLSICEISSCGGILVGESTEDQGAFVASNITRCRTIADAVEYIKKKEEEER